MKKQNIELFLWRVLEGDWSNNFIRCQINQINLKTKSTIIKMMEDWKIVGEIYPAKEGNDFGLVFMKNFQDVKKIKEWAKLISYPVFEITTHGNKIPLNKDAKKKIVVKSSKTKTKTRQNKCKICGELGHNARTCSKRK